MRIATEILDLIFSFLSSDHGTLFACMKDPMFSPIVKRHLNHHIIVYIGPKRQAKKYKCAFTPESLYNIVSNDPRVLHRVRVLQVQADFRRVSSNRKLKSVIEPMDKFATTLLVKFPALVCIKLMSDEHEWHWSDIFWAALENRLKLSTTKELHLTGNSSGRFFPLPLLRKCTNIEQLSFSGPFHVGDFDSWNSTLPHLSSLSLTHVESSVIKWCKLSVKQLCSLRSGKSTRLESLIELLGVYSETLCRLEIDFGGSEYLKERPFYDEYDSVTSTTSQGLEYPSIPNLRTLTLHALISLIYNKENEMIYCKTTLHRVTQAIASFKSSVQHLVLDIHIEFEIKHLDYAEPRQIDLSALADLTTSFLSIPLIDLYVHTGIFPSDLTHDELMKWVNSRGSISKAVEDRRLLLHSEQTASSYY